MEWRSVPARAAALAVAGALLAAGATATNAFACEHTLASPAKADAATLRAAVLCLVNEERGRRGLRDLATDHRLRRAAMAHARDMVRRDYFSHVTPGGRDLLDRVRATGYAHGTGWKIGEAIAWGLSRRGTPRAIVRGWMNSPGHRALILDRGFTEAGVGVARGAPRQRTRNGGTYVLDFGRP
jgi:uncharacterized protein YkwD